LLEARAARTDTARRIFKYLLQQAPWYGPVWHEACRFEHRCNPTHGLGLGLALGTLTLTLSLSLTRTLTLSLTRTLTLTLTPPRCNHLHEALHVAEQGLLQLPRYGPLWFCALRLQECNSQKQQT